MPSLQSFLFRFLMKRGTGLLKARDGVAGWRRLSAKSGTPRLPPGVTLRPLQAAGVPCEWLCPGGAEDQNSILYLHGGGFVLGWYNPHRMMVGYLAQACRACALAVDYRLAPEAPFPAALDDCLAVYRSLLKGSRDPGSIIFAGDSAGGNLTLAMLLASLGLMGAIALRRIKANAD